MSSGEDLYYIIVAANVELQNILSLLLHIYADVHAFTNPPAAGINALCSLLSSDIDLLKTIVKDYVSGKLYTSEDKEAVLPDVDSKQFDSSLLLDILIKVLLTKYLNGNCSKCSGVCCPDCIHSENSCKRCKKNVKKPTEKCWHKCKKCKKPAKECSKTICCITCNTCLNCNKDIVTAILNDLPLKSSPCEWFLLTHSLHLSTLFRKLFAHVTVQECEKFTTGILTPLSENLQIFQICGNRPQLQKYVTFMFSYLVKHTKVKCLQLPSPSSEILDVLLKAMDSLKFIFEHGVSQEKYLQYSEKAKQIFIDNKEFHETLKSAESRILKAIKENQEKAIASNDENTKKLEEHVTKTGHTLLAKQETDKQEIIGEIKDLKEAVYQEKNGKKPRTVSSVALCRHLDKGFVLEMPFEKDRKIEKVEYKYKDGSWIEAEADRKISNGIIYLRVEKIKSGKYQVRVISYLGGAEREDPLVVDVQDLLDRETDFLFTITPPCEAVPLLHEHWKKDVCLEDRTVLIITVFDSSDSEESKQSFQKTSDVKEFSDLGVRYLKINHINKVFDKVLKFPPSSMIKDDLVNDIRDSFSDLLKNEIGLRAVISNYADFKYFQFIDTGTEKDYVETSFSDVPSENRLLLFCSELSTIASIRIVNDKSKILEEMDNCFDDLKSFCYTFKRLIKGNVILTILLVCCEISREEIKEEIKFYFNKEFENQIEFFFLTKDEFGKDGKSIPEDWWKKIFKKKLHESLMDHPPPVSEDTEMFKEILGQCMATIAWCDKESKSRLLPTLFGDEHQQILTLLPSESQLEAIHSREKKKLIYGPFGSGKTIVAECLVRLIYENSLKEDTKMKTLIVYAIQDDHSLLEVKNKYFVDRLEKGAADDHDDDNDDDDDDDDMVIIKHGTFRSLTGLDDGKSLLDFVEGVLKKETTFSNFNFILDEVDHQSIEGEGDVKELKMKLENQLENLKKIDHFIIFPRSANLQVQLAGKKKPNESYLYKLIDKKYQLEVVMRNSNEIVEAVESCQKSVEPTECVCKIPVATMPFHNNDLERPVMSIPETKDNIKHLNTRDSNEVLPGNPEENSNQENEDSNAVLSGNPEIENPAQNSNQENKDSNAVLSGNPEIENPAQNSNQENEDSNAVSSENPKENEENNPAVAINVAEVNEPIEPITSNKGTTFQSNSLQEAKEITKKNEKPETFKSIEFKTSFIKCKPGNNVSKGTPRLINLPLKFDKRSDNGAKILSIILDKICLKTFRGYSRSSSHDIRSPIIICNEMDEVKITYYALSLVKRLPNCCCVYVPLLQRKDYLFNEKKKIYDEITGGKNILITDNSSFRGMESQHVITFFNPLEKFDRYLLPEIMTRATVSLDIIAFRVDNDTAEVVSNWKEEGKLVNVVNVNISHERKSGMLCTPKIKEEFQIYDQSEEFKEFRDSVTFQEFKEQHIEEFRITQDADVSSDLPKISSESKDQTFFGFVDPYMDDEHIYTDIDELNIRRERLPTPPEEHTETPNLERQKMLYVNANMKPKIEKLNDSNDIEKSPGRSPRTEEEDQEFKASRMRNHLVNNLRDSEKCYLDCLEMLVKFMKPLRVSTESSQPILSVVDFKTIFHKTDEMLKLHKEFFKYLKPRVEHWNDGQLIGDLFTIIMHGFDLYLEYVGNYKSAKDTITKCRNANQQFADIMDQDIRIPPLKFPLKLEGLLYKPIDRVTQYSLILNDLLKYTSPDHPDHPLIVEVSGALFDLFEQVNVDSPKKKRRQRQLLKETSVVEIDDGERRPRSLILFNDVIISAKLKPSTDAYVCKWYASLVDINIKPYANSEKAAIMPVSSKIECDKIRANIANMRQEVRREHMPLQQRRNVQEPRASSRGIENIKKKIAEQERLLHLIYPSTQFNIYHKNGKCYTMLVTVEAERQGWIEALKPRLKRIHARNPPSIQLSSLELQQAFETVLKVQRLGQRFGSPMPSPFLGPTRPINLDFSMFEDDKESLTGYLYVNLHYGKGFTKNSDTYVVLEMDSYGHFFKKAKTKPSRGSDPQWEESFEFEIEACSTLRLSCFNKLRLIGDDISGKCSINLTKENLTDNRNHTLSVRLDRGQSVLNISLCFSTSIDGIKKSPSFSDTGVFGYL